MTRSVPEATIAVGRVRLMPFGRARAEAAARQVRLIEAEGPDEVRAYALESLVEALTWTGDSGRALVPFVKLLRWWDAHPEHFDQGDQNILFWEFGWIVNDMCRDPAVPVARVEAALDDMERRFALANRGLERVWSCRLDWELLRLGPNLRETFTTWLTMPVDDEDSCPACHQEHHADYLIETGDLAGAAAIVEAAITAELSCSREPASMLAMLAWCYTEMGRLADVERIVPQALGEVRASAAASVLVAYARLFEVFGRGADPARAAALLPRIVEGLGSATAYVRLEAMRHLLSGALCLVQQGAGDHPLAVAGLDPTDIAAFTSWVEDQAVELTTLFDTRHGGSVQAVRLARARSARPTARPLAAAAPVAAPPAAEPAPPAAPSPHRIDYPSTRDQAEAAFQSGKHRLAAVLYRTAAEEAEADGQVGLAGWCWAEAARNAQETGAWQTATHDYVEAHARLRAGGVTLEEISPLFVAWAPGVQQADYHTFLNLALQDYPSPAGPSFTESIEEVLPSVFQAGMVNSPLIRRYVLARAELRDAVARVMATWGGSADKLAAVAMAEEAASRFSTLGRADAAAHSWWLAGKVAVQTSSDSVETSYMKALEGFAATGDRNNRFRRAAAGEYAEYLNQTGRPEQAAEILATWGVRAMGI